MNSARLLFIACFAVLLAACTAPSASRQSAKVSAIENTKKFVVTDAGSPVAVHCTGLQERVLPDGRLEVTANVRNGETRTLRLQISCTFKDETGSAAGDGTPGQEVQLAKTETRVFRFLSADNLARDYTISVTVVP